MGAKDGYGWGKGNAFKPTGGYYARQVKVQLHAEVLGHCTYDAPRAYTVLYARFQKRPGGRMGGWFLWGDRPICK